ncbi:ferritin, chloroplastic-like [Quercus robur]|uniref:ferritin, chloroplastic-like n=1 Tax=Quercus robur TaxID=38942 RepID=UPI0021627989|nr:ferritin, chloroplastic-like [Quercus robur]
MTRKEKENERHNSDSLVKVVNKEEKDNSSKKSNSLKEEIDERLKSIERSMTYTQDNGLVEAIKKISEYVAQLRRVGKGHGVWHFDQMLPHDAQAA